MAPSSALIRQVMVPGLKRHYESLKRKGSGRKKRKEERRGREGPRVEEGGREGMKDKQENMNEEAKAQEGHAEHSNFGVSKHI